MSRIDRKFQSAEDEVGPHYKTPQSLLQLLLSH